MTAVVFIGAGGNEVVVVSERPDPVAGPDEVVVAVEVAGLNPADLHQRDGHYPAPPGAVPDVPGLEVAGDVVAVGARVASWVPGDRVFGLVGGGGLATRVVVHDRCVTRVPDRLDAEAAAAVPEAFITAHDALRQSGLRPGETVLVRGATGAVGNAAVQLARASGSRVLAPVASPEAAESVGRAGAEPMEEEATGVDVVIELVGGDHVEADLGCVKVGGRIVVVSVAAGATVELDLLRLMAQRASVRGTVLRARPLEEKASAVQAFAREVVPMLADGRVSPAIDRVVDVADVHDAFDRLAARGKRGKVLVRFP